jgi:coenzyme F420-reducing hydrogenase beta subunit
MTSFFGHKTKSKSALCSGCGALYIFFNGFYITRNKSPKTFKAEENLKRDCLSVTKKNHERVCASSEAQENVREGHRNRIPEPAPVVPRVDVHN